MQKVDGDCHAICYAFGFLEVFQWVLQAVLSKFGANFHHANMVQIVILGTLWQGYFKTQGSHFSDEHPQATNVQTCLIRCMVKHTNRCEISTADSLKYSLLICTV